MENWIRRHTLYDVCLTSRWGIFFGYCTLRSCWTGHWIQRLYRSRAVSTLSVQIQIICTSPAIRLSQLSKHSCGVLRFLLMQIFLGSWYIDISLKPPPVRWRAATCKQGLASVCWFCLTSLFFVSGYFVLFYFVLCRSISRLIAFVWIRTVFLIASLRKLSCLWNISLSRSNAVWTSCLQVSFRNEDSVWTRRQNDWVFSGEQWRRNYVRSLLTK